MFEGLFLFNQSSYSLSTALLAWLIAYWCYNIIKDATKNLRLARVCFGVNISLGIIHTIIGIGFWQYCVLIIIPTCVFTLYGLWRNPDAKQDLFRKIADIDKGIYILILMVIVATISLAISTYTPAPSGTETIEIGNISMEIPASWSRNTSEDQHQEYSSDSYTSLNGTVILEIIQPSSDTPTPSFETVLTDEVNKIYSGAYFDNEYALISKVKKGNTNFAGNDAIVFYYYFTHSDWIEDNINFAYYAKDVFFEYHNQVYRLSFYSSGPIAPSYGNTARQQTLKFANRFLETLHFK